MSNQPASPPTAFSFGRLIALGIGAKFVVDTGFQIFNPYLTIFAAGLNLDVVTMGRLVSLISAMGILAPLLGVMADRVGYRLVMRLGLISAALGALLMGSSSRLWMVAVSLILMGLGFSIFAPMLHAYLSAIIPYHRRARSLGMVEYSWALASIFGLSLMGQIIALTNWRVPFFILGAGLATAWLVYRRLPSIPLARRTPGLVTIAGWRHWPGQLRAYFDLGQNAPSAWGSILAGAVNFFACLHIMIVHGVWLNREYGLGAAQLGLVALVLGLADLAGSVLVSLVSDRLGKRRSVFLGTLGSLLVYLALPYLNISFTAALMSLVLVRFTFEFSIVSNIPLLSEQVPQQRGKVLTLGAFFYLASGTLVGFTGPWAYTTFGVWGLGPVSAVAVVVSLLLIWGWVREIEERR